MKSTGKKPAKKPAIEQPGRDMLVRLDRLSISEANMRKVHHEDGLVEPAALIESQGLLQRLSIVADGEDGRFGVVAGGRRLGAMQMLAFSWHGQVSAR